MDLDWLTSMGIAVSVLVVMIAMTYDWLASRYRASLIRAVLGGRRDQIDAWTLRRHRWIAHALDVERDAIDVVFRRTTADENARARREKALARVEAAAAKLHGSVAGAAV